MIKSFKDMKKGSQSEFQKLNEKLKQLNESPFKTDDERFWTLTVDKAKNGYAVIRFLPQTDGEDLPFVRYWDHGFKGPGGWFIENSLTSLNQPDPVSEYNMG